MVWRADDEQGSESKKIVWEVAPYLRGKGLDLGAGVFKILPHVIAVDNGNHAMFGHHIQPDVMVDTAEKLDLFATRSLDFVFSSHLLEHIEDYAAALAEWWRVIKQGGHLVLYLPHKKFYPNIGQPGANPTHVHDFMPEDIIGVMEKIGGWDLLEKQDRNEGKEYSMLLVFKRTHGKACAYSHAKPKSEKRALVCRFGAFGDLMQAASVLSGLKEQGYHITLIASYPGVSVLEHDPNVDEFMILDKDQIPNPDLGSFWEWQAAKYDKFVNLSESVEGTWLGIPGRAQEGWSPLVRHKVMNRNYLEFQHDLAGVPHKPHIKFYATPEEKNWALKTRSGMGKFVIMWSLAGSSVHKVWPHLDAVVAALMLNFSDVHVVFVGGPECVILEKGWENEKRVHLTSGKWSIRQTMSFLEQTDLVIGPETGVLNAASCMPMPKIVFLSHSTEENLTRDWVNTVSLYAKNLRCAGRDRDEVTACHMLHYDWSNCTQNKGSGMAVCMHDILPGEVCPPMEHFINLKLKKAV